jgi:5-oxoprolinase (ATP-hydrolysing)/N-methylhydantoinase A
LAVVTTAGFRDVLQFRRGKRESPFALDWRPPAPLVPRDRIFEVDERISADGEILVPLDARDLEELGNELEAVDVAAVAVVLLHSYRNPAHEAAVGAYLQSRFPELAVILSSAVAPQIGEYERTSTTVVHAALSRIITDYVGEIERRTGSDRDESLYIMQSNGGLAHAGHIARAPALAIESGPAAGAIHAGQLAHALGLKRAIAFDLGGTTAKACLLEDGQPSECDELTVGGSMHAGAGFKDPGGYVVRTRAVDLAEVGAGGGSVCTVDDGGVLHVGPESAGSDPGPVAFGFGGEQPTVTDAAVVLGFIDSATSAYRGLQLDADAARAAIATRIAAPLDISVEEAAWLVFEVANSNMSRAIAAVSTERGRDPASCALIAFGGGGPMHACFVASRMRMRDVLVPVYADVFSAAGLLRSPLRRDANRSHRISVDELTNDWLTGVTADLELEVGSALRSPAYGTPELRCSLEIGFEGQHSTMSVDITDADRRDDRLRDAVETRFRAQYLEEHGHIDDSGRLEVVGVRLRAEADPPEPAPPLADVTAVGEVAEQRRVYWGPEHGWIVCPVYRRIHAEIVGPAIIAAPNASIVVPPGVRADRDDAGNVRITVPSDTTDADRRASGSSSFAGLQLLRNAVGVVVDRMAHTLVRTGYSSMTTELHDFSIGVCDADGNVVHQGLGILMHLGSIPGAMRALRASGVHPLHDGDVVLLNDPYHGGTHLPDFVVVAPVYVDGGLVAHTVVMSHVIDVGGLTPGSVMTHATELLQEGLVIPPVRIRERGTMNRSLLELIERNVRQPAEVVGDLHALIAAADIGTSVIRELVGETGAPRFVDGMRDLLTYGERRGRSELARFGRAEGSFTDHIEDDTAPGGLLTIAARVRIADGEVYASLDGTSPQVLGGINSNRLTSESMLQASVRSLLPEDFPESEGLHRLVHLSVPDGTLVSAVDDAPVAARSLSAFRLANVLQGALADALPGAVPALGDDINPVAFNGRRADGTRFTFVDLIGGTTGGGPHQDGCEGIAPLVGNARHSSVEVVESRYPIRVLRYEQVSGTGGGGRYRGGNAMSREYEAVGDVQVMLRSDRRRRGPAGLAGGSPGAPSRATLTRIDGETECFGNAARFDMRPGDRLVCEGSGGGGYGTPSD